MGNKSAKSVAARVAIRATEAKLGGKASLLFMLLAMLGGCPSPIDEQPKAETAARRVIEPPPKRVHALPPHNIYLEGLGPYKIGASLQDVLSHLSRGPRVELLSLQNLFDYSIVRAENELLQVGVGESDVVEFVAALSPEVARTESGLGVGSTRWELEKKLGKESELHLRVDDPRVVRYKKMPRTRFILSGQQVLAIIVGGDESGVEKHSAKLKKKCEKTELSKNPSTATRVARIANGAVSIGCVDGAEIALVQREGKVAVIWSQPGKPKRLVVSAGKGLVYAALLDTTGDGDDELVFINERRTDVTLAVTLRIDAVSATRANTILERLVYKVEGDAARWVGASLDEIELLVSVAREARALEVSGLFLQRGPKNVRNLVPLTPLAIEPPKAVPGDDRDKSLRVPAKSKDGENDTFKKVPPASGLEVKKVSPAKSKKSLKAKKPRQPRTPTE